MSRAKIEFFTEHTGLMDFPPVPASKMIPKWFKATEPSHNIAPQAGKFPFGISSLLRISNINSTIKRCPGILSFLAEGFIIPLWADLLVQVRGDKIHALYSNQTTSVGLHSKQMHYPNMPSGDEYVSDALKIINPWKIRTPKGYSTLMLAPFYHFEKRFTLVPGVTDSDTYPHLHAINLFRKGDADHQLKLGMPLMLVVPFRRERWDLDVRAATEADKERVARLDLRAARFFDKNRTWRDTSE